MKGLCEPVQDKKKPGNYVLSCDGLIVFPPRPITDASHKYLIDFEVRTSRTGKRYGVATSAEVFHEFVTVKEESKANLDVQNYGTYYVVTLTSTRYKVENDEGNKDIHFNDFYIATFDDTASEVVWGVGYSIESALKSAEREWDGEVGDEDLNPFTEALEKLKD